MLRVVVGLSFAKTALLGRAARFVVELHQAPPCWSWGLPHEMGRLGARRELQDCLPTGLESLVRVERLEPNQLGRPRQGQGSSVAMKHPPLEFVDRLKLERHFERLAGQNLQHSNAQHAGNVEFSSDHHEFALQAPPIVLAVA